MPNAFWPEWIIARLTDRSRAAAIVGDLFEGAAEQGTVWFWLSVTGILLSLSWRSLIGSVTGFFGLYFVHALPMPLYSVHAVHRPPELWVPFFGLLGALCMVLWVAAPYAAVRYGFRDSFAQLALMLCGLVTTVIFYWWIPAVDVTCLAVALSILFCSGLFAEWRRAFLALAVALALGLGGVRFIWELSLVSATLSSRIRDSLPLFAVALQTTACGWMHRLLFQPNQQGSGIEPAA